MGSVAHVGLEPPTPRGSLFQVPLVDPTRPAEADPLGQGPGLPTWNKVSGGCEALQRAKGVLY